MSGSIWLVYSREHNAWWGPNKSGYTHFIEKAGRYSKKDAQAICKVRGWRSEDEPPEVACIAPEAGGIITDLLEALTAIMRKYRHIMGDDTAEIIAAYEAITKADPTPSTIRSIATAEADHG